MQAATAGVLLAVFSGILLGNSMLPLNYLRKWRWENAWVVFSLVALVVMPWTLAVMRVPRLLELYSHIESAQYILPFLFGIGWGMAQVLFGLSVAKIGMSLAFPITIGLSAILGTSVPLVLKHPELATTDKGLLLGVALVLAGVFCCGWAGLRRDAEQQKAQASDMTKGLLMAVIAGILAPMLNYGLAFGDVFLNEALRAHVASTDAPYAVWPVVLAGGAIPNLAFSIYLNSSNRTWGRFFDYWPDIFLGISMGILWMGATAIYGVATTRLGALGVSVGWSIFQVCIILTANISGILCGEWRKASLRSRMALWTAVLLLTSATIAITYGSL